MPKGIADRKRQMQALIACIIKDGSANKLADRWGIHRTGIYKLAENGARWLNEQAHQDPAVAPILRVAATRLQKLTTPKARRKA